MSPLLLALLALEGASPKPAPVAEQAFYELGHGIAVEYRMRDAEIGPLLEGVGDAREGAPPRGPLRDHDPSLWTLKVQREAIARAEKEGADFTDNFAKQTGSTVEPTGMVFLEKAAGAGPSPTASDRVTVHYTAAGTSLRTFEHDFGRNRGQPATFPVRALTPCWQQALARMKPGGRALFACPGALALGEAGRRSPEGHEVVRPGTTLVYAVELLAVAPMESEASAPAPAPKPAVAVAGSPQYAFGYRLGRHISLEDDDVNAFERGLRAGARGEAREPPDEATRKAHETLLQERRARAAKANRAAGKAYAAKAAREKGAVKLRSGVVFRSLEPGEGALVTDGLSLKLAIRGHLPNGAEIHPAVEPQQVRWSSLKGLEPPCLEEAVRRMRPAARARVVCPSSVGYGDEGAWDSSGISPVVPGGETLVYELELLEVSKPGGG